MDNSQLEELAQAERARQEKFQQRIYCCASTACLSAGAGDTVSALEQGIKNCRSGEHGVEVVKTGCMGLCSQGPLVRVESKDEPPALYGGVTPKIACEIIEKHVPHCECSSTPDISPAHGAELEFHHISLDLPFFQKQKRVVLDGMGQIDPEKLEDYLAYGGFQSLAKVLRELTPGQVCDEILRSGLRGRGGAGFPTGQKWNLVRQETAPRKFVIVNGDEGDPGAYMDRAVLEDDPYRVLEGMIICAYAVGASYGYLYIRGEYPNAIQRISRAIRMAKRRGLLGKSVLGTDFHFDCDVRIGRRGLCVRRRDRPDPFH